MILLDTHVLVWLWTGAYLLGKSARRMMDVALRDQELGCIRHDILGSGDAQRQGSLDFTEDVGL